MTTQYLEFENGLNEVYLTGIIYKAQSDFVKRSHLKLTFASESSADNFEAPFTSQMVSFPRADDAQFTKILMDKKLKNIVLPILEIDPKTKVKMSTLYPKLVEALSKFDFKCEVDAVLKEGKSVNKETGELMMFTELLSLKPMEAIEKVAYESTVDWDEPDLDFE